MTAMKMRSWLFAPGDSEKMMAYLSWQSGRRDDRVQGMLDRSYLSRAQQLLSSVSQ